MPYSPSPSARTPHNPPPPAAAAATDLSRPQLFFSGCLEGCEGTAESTALCCSFSLRYDSSSWRLLRGAQEGATFVSECDGESRYAVWNHPLEGHFAFSSVKGWPRLELRVFEEHPSGGVEVAGHGFIHLPTTPGHHDLTCWTWRPTPASGLGRLQVMLLGGVPQIVNTSGGEGRGGGDGGSPASTLTQPHLAGPDVCVESGGVRVRVSMDVALKNVREHGIVV
ncbi:unnamed protein product [Vitrella brassicaformis CCMP3155]|uniref:B9 domain-containing protein n=2 Tax=Vitrella brassicaformis TaxID=1169539 RepID=A0A0G4EPV7_VITBC|nr:unnamed protein product [Vitrella brassicaformis CCMP3155]|eukprot:CEL99613.1 unnamed protein product [Vitrella brassicaformis CCMP3155]